MVITQLKRLLLIKCTIDECSEEVNAELELLRFWNTLGTFYFLPTGEGRGPEEGDMHEVLMTRQGRSLGSFSHQHRSWPIVACLPRHWPLAQWGWAGRAALRGPAKTVGLLRYHCHPRCARISAPCLLCGLQALSILHAGTEQVHFPLSQLPTAHPPKGPATTCPPASPCCFPELSFCDSIPPSHQARRVQL